MCYTHTEAQEKHTTACQQAAEQRKQFANALDTQAMRHAAALAAQQEVGCLCT